MHSGSCFAQLQLTGSEGFGLWPCLGKVVSSIAQKCGKPIQNSSWLTFRHFGTSYNVMIQWKSWAIGVYSWLHHQQFHNVVFEHWCRHIETTSVDPFLGSQDSRVERSYRRCLSDHFGLARLCRAVRALCRPEVDQQIAGMSMSTGCNWDFGESYLVQATVPRPRMWVSTRRWNRYPATLATFSNFLFARCYLF